MQSRAAANFIITLFALAGLAATYLAAYRIQSYLTNSDALYLPTLFQDLLERGGTLRDWYLTPAPYFFPDYGIYFLAYIVGVDSYHKILFYPVIQALAAYIIFYFFFASFRIRCAIPLSILAWLVLVFLALNAGEPFPFLLVSAHHSGAFLSAILCIALAMQSHRANNESVQWILVFVLCAICFITALSDNLFVVQLVLPLSALLCFAAPFVPFLRKKLLFQGVAVGVSGLFGSLSYPLFVTNNTRYKLVFSLDNIQKNAIDIISISETMFREEPIALMLLATFYAITFICLIAALSSDFVKTIGPDLIAFSFFVWLSAVVTILIVLLTMTPIVPVTPRYFIAVYSWPIPGVLVILAKLIKKWFTHTITVASTAIIIYLSVCIAEPVMVSGIDLKFRPNEVSCIDNALAGKNLTNGVGGYWDAKYLQTFSAVNPIIAQHGSMLDEFRWITSERFFRPNYDFAVISANATPIFKISEQMIRRINGAPKETVVCGQKILMIYGTNKLKIAKITNINDSFEWKGCELPTRVGVYNSACEIEYDGYESGYVSFGPYERLGAGKYHFEIRYSSRDNEDSIVGNWDVSVGPPKEPKIIAKGPIFGTNDVVNKAQGDFVLEKGKKIEIRTLAKVGSSMKYISLKVVRTE